MATNPTVYRLSIALIVFVLLTFVLTFATYFMFKQRMDEQVRAQAAEKAASDKEAELRAATEDLEKFRQVIGEPEGTAGQITEDNFNKLLSDEFAGFNEEPKSYLKLVEWLRGQVRVKDESVQAAVGKTKEAEAAAAKSSEQAAEIEKKSAAEVQAAKQQQDDAKKAFDAQWAGHEAEQKKLLDGKQTAEQKSNRLEMLISRIADGGQYLSSARQKDFKSRDTAEDQLGVIYAELRDRAKAIDEQNRILAGLRVADRELQQKVLAATPKDDRVDGLDGRILSVDETTRSVLVSCSSTRGIRTGMVLHVFPPDDSRPQIGDRKGTVEVTEIEGPSLVRAAIRRDSIRTPILAGDGVATSLWAAGAAPEVVIVGYVNLDDSGAADNKRLAEIVERAGARVAQSVSTTTALVVDGGKPSPQAGEREVEAFAEEARRQRRSVEAAKQFGVRVVGIDALLDMLGLTRESITANSLPRAAGLR
ncbi:MAG: hypothetical protein K8S94_09470 [Planctomycetia bacterium]|nr:hypothetical protein [Planctomycetia bacterium]